MPFNEISPVCVNNPEIDAPPEIVIAPEISKALLGSVLPIPTLPPYVNNGVTNIPFCTFVLFKLVFIVLVDKSKLPVSES